MILLMWWDLHGDHHDHHHLFVCVCRIDWLVLHNPAELSIRNQSASDGDDVTLKEIVSCIFKHLLEILAKAMNGYVLQTKNWITQFNWFWLILLTGLIPGIVRKTVKAKKSKKVGDVFWNFMVDQPVHCSACIWCIIQIGGAAKGKRVESVLHILRVSINTKQDDDDGGGEDNVGGVGLFWSIWESACQHQFARFSWKQKISLVKRGALFVTIQLGSFL